MGELNSVTDWRFVLFGAGVLWLMYVSFGYPIALWLFSFFKRVTPRASDHYPYVSVLISARNEEKDIGWKVQETLDWNYPADKLEVLVASDASEDGTDAALRMIADPRLRLFRSATRRGKNRAINALVQEACGELLFFTDANAHIESGTLARMTRHFADGSVGCVTGRTLVSENATHGGAIGNGAALYWGYETLLQSLESRIGSTLVCDGAIFCTRASLFRELIPDIGNDLQVPVDVAAAGSWVIYEPSAIAVEADTSSVCEELNRRRRICGQGALAMLKLFSSIRGIRLWQFFSRKILRWFTAVPMLLIFVSCVALRRVPLFATLLLMQIVFYLTASMSWVMTELMTKLPRVVSVPFYIVLGAFGALLGIIDTLAGRRYAVWDIPALSRGHRGA